MFKKQKLIAAVLMFVCTFVLNAMSVFATSHEYYTTYAEPMCSESSGYINLLLKNSSSGMYIINTYFWNISSLNSSNVESSAYAYIELSKDYLYFTVGSVSGVSGYYHLAVYGADGKITEVATSSSSATTKTFSSGWECVGYKYKGNVGYFYRQPNFNEYIDYNVYFSSDSSAVLLSSIVDLLGSLSLDNDTIMARLYSILNSVDGVETQLESVISWLKEIESELQVELNEINEELDQIYYKAEAILAEQQETNTWLEKIYNFFAEKDEKDKEAATQQGNQSTSDVTDVIQDDSAGFVDSLGGLTSSMSYSGTECSWTFPTVKLPAISGVMDEVTLIESQEIDFTYWVNSIPSGILLLIQSVCTVALIIFCFKELYGTIEYVLTLRKGGGS